MPTELFIYYRAAAHQVEAITAAVGCMQSQLRLEVPREFVPPHTRTHMKQSSGSSIMQAEVHSEWQQQEQAEQAE